MTVARYEFRGTTDEVTCCDHCGRQDLKGTVVLNVLDADGNVEDVVYFGTTCAARAIASRWGDRFTTPEVIRAARAADRARREVWDQWRDTQLGAELAIEDAWLAARGLERTYQTFRLLQADPDVQARIAAWNATHPEPER